MSTAPPRAPTPAGDEDRTVIRPPQSSDRTTPEAAPAAQDIGHGNALPTGTRLGEFEITQMVGEGGFGIVYLAQDHSLQRRVALKEYMPSALAARAGPTQVSVKSERHRETFALGLRSFVNEARLLAQFDHPSLVKVYRFWEANGTAYMVMPFYEGITLKDKLRELGTPPDEAWLMALLAPLTEALSVIHAEQCYHRDIAPDNVILLAGSGKPLLLDFGAARRVIGDMTHALTVILKPGYAPLEQYAEVPGMQQGPWTDVYALAAVVYYAITGKTPPTAVGRMMNDQYVPLAECARGRYSERFVTAIDHALRVRPEDRTQSIGALRAELGMAEHDIGDYDTRPASFADSLQSATRGPGAATTAAGPRQAERSTPHAPVAKSRLGMWLGMGAAALVAIGFIAFYALRAPTMPAPAVSSRDTATTPAVQSPGVVPVNPGPATPPATGPATTTPAAAETPPATAAPEPAAPPAAQLPYSVGREFDRIVQAATPGFAVQAEAASPQLRIGRDRLSFNITSSQAGRVYVLLEGPDGSLMLLFPNSASSENRVRAGQTLRLPQTSWLLDTAEPPGPERFLVMVSRAARDFSSISQGRDGWFLKLPTGQTAADLAAGFTGPGSVLAGRAECSEPGCDAYGAARFEVDVKR